MLLCPGSGGEGLGGFAPVEVACGQNPSPRHYELGGLAERNGIGTLPAGIFAEKLVGLILFASCGFREVGRRARIL
jgi:hypothetical protein